MRKTLIWLLCFTCLVGFIVYLIPSDDTKDVGYSEFVSLIEKGEFTKIVIDPHEKMLRGVREKGTTALSHYVGDEDMAERFRAQGIEVEVNPSSTFNAWPLIALGVLVIFFVFLFRAMSRMGGGGAGGTLNFTGSKARKENPKDFNVTFDDVKGCDEAKREVSEYLDYSRNRHQFLRFGAKLPSGILLIGPPGCGKTMLAKALACEAGVPFFSISGSDFVEMYVGVGAARVRSMMEEVRRAAPSILFIDEIDAVGRRRGAGIGNQNDEREQTLNQILVELDGVSNNRDILVIAATNRPDILDPALIRPGRIDKKVYLPTPDIIGRQEILESYAKAKPLGPDINFAVLAKLTYGANGADLESLVNEAALIAAHRDAEYMTMHDFEMANDKIALGTERRIVMVEDEKRRVAIHEAGHAVIAEVAEVVPVRKVTVMPRANALGLTHTLSEEERYLSNEEGLLGQIQMLFGGRVAEKTVYDDYSTGASDDLKRATAIARSMVMRYGMSQKVGPVVFVEEQGPTYLGQTLGENAVHSEATRHEIDQEVKAILTSCEEKVVSILLSRKVVLEAIADALMEHETITGDTVRELIAEHSS